MIGQPPGSGGCCPPRGEGISYLRIGSEQYLVGMIGLQAVFEQLRMLDRAPEDVTDAELVATARKSNYIPNSARVEADYAAALRTAYSNFRGRAAHQRPEAKGN